MGALALGANAAAYYAKPEPTTTPAYYETTTTPAYYETTTSTSAAYYETTTSSSSCTTSTSSAYYESSSKEYPVYPVSSSTPVYKVYPTGYYPASYPVSYSTSTLYSTSCYSESGVYVTKSIPYSTTVCPVTYTPVISATYVPAPSAPTTYAAGTGAVTPVYSAKPTYVTAAAGKLGHGMQLAAAAGVVAAAALL